MKLRCNLEEKDKYRSTTTEPTIYIYSLVCEGTITELEYIKKKIDALLEKTYNIKGMK